MRDLVLLLCLSSICLLAQYGSGTILGSVTDSSNAVIPGATITIKNLETEEARSFKTDASGNFRFNAVPPGTYTVTAGATSFKTVVLTNLSVAVNTETRADITMQVGQVADTVNVEAAAPLFRPIPPLWALPLITAPCTSCP